MFAAGLLAMLLMTGIVIDGGNLFQEKQSVQNAADAAALAAAAAITNGGCNFCGGIAGMYAGFNGVSGPNGDVTSSTAPGLPVCGGGVTDTTAPAAAPGCYEYPYIDDQAVRHDDEVEVWLTRNTSNFFGGVL